MTQETYFEHVTQVFVDTAIRWLQKPSANMVALIATFGISELSAVVGLATGLVTLAWASANLYLKRIEIRRALRHEADSANARLDADDTRPPGA